LPSTETKAAAVVRVEKLASKQNTLQFSLSNLNTMPEKTFKPGDIVQLKSGGPKMTVEAHDDRLAVLLQEVEQVQCRWFAGSKLQSGMFDASSLKLVEN
jgi:uncharacterized protein YodC (DUF2158 family)